VGLKRSTCTIVLSPHVSSDGHRNQSANLPTHARFPSLQVQASTTNQTRDKSPCRRRPPPYPAFFGRRHLRPHPPSYGRHPIRPYPESAPRSHPPRAAGARQSPRLADSPSPPRTRGPRRCSSTAARTTATWRRTCSWG
jgi:hypothetical protein